MIQKTNSIARNTTYYTMALIIQKILAFIYFSLIARFLGVEDMGKYSFALSFTTLFAIFIDFGLSPVLTREIAKAKDKAQEYLSNIMALKIPLAIATYLLAIGLVNIFGYPDITKNLVYISGLIMMIDSFSLSFWAVSRGYQYLKYESLGIILLQGITVSLGTVFIFLKFGPVAIMIALLCGSVINFIVGAGALKWKFGLNIMPRYTPETLRFLFKIGVPFALAGIFSRIYTSLDMVILSILTNDLYVGWYSIPIKVISALQFLPLAFMAALFPAMSDYFINDRKKLKIVFEKAISYLMILSVPLAAGIIMLAESVVRNIYSESYLNSVLPLRILMVGLFFVFINFPIGYLLNACSKQTVNTINMGAVVAINIILNIVLIPRYTYVGAACASLVSTIIQFVLGMIQVPKIIDYSKRHLAIIFLKILFSAGAMAGAIYYLQPFLTGMMFLWLIPFGAIIYFLTLWLTGGILREDIGQIWQSIKK